MKKTFLILFTLAMGSAAHSQTNIVIESLDFNTDGVLPSSEGNVAYNAPYGTAESLVYSVSGGLLHQNSTSVNDGPSYIDYNNQLNSSLNLSMEAEIDITSISGAGGVTMQALDGAYRYSLFFAPGQVNVLTASGTISVNLNLSGFHTYRLETDANSPVAHLFYDDTYVTSWEGPAYTTLNGFSFGDGISATGNSASADWNYLTVKQDVALTPVPEPATCALLVGLAGLGVVSFRRKHAKGASLLAVRGKVKTATNAGSIRRVLLLLFALFSPFAVKANPVVVTVGSYQYDGSGLPGGDLGLSMNNPSNYTLFGVDSFADGGEVAFGGATAGYLSTIDIFFTDLNGIYSSPNADISNLVTYVNDGGVLVINNDRSTSFTTLDPLLNAFGIDLIEAPTDNIESLDIQVPSHPIMNGPFGTVTSMGLRDASRYSALSGDVSMLATWQNGDGAIAVVEPGHGRMGAVIVLPDVERFLLDFDTIFGSGDTDMATLNAVAYAVSIPEPSTYTLLFGLGILGLVAIRKLRPMR